MPKLSSGEALGKKRTAGHDQMLNRLSLKEERMRSSPAGFGEAASCTAAGVSAAEERLQYSSKCGKVHLDNVAIRNLGVDWTAPGNVYWKHHVNRREAVRIVLQGRSEFEATDVVISGGHTSTYTVPDGYRMVVNQVRTLHGSEPGQNTAW
ncbi:hypothetical protein CEUSTIGMA_g2270.t1 [Chlamydomonas eustigma]|uniref:UGP3-like C-terminal hexapeptide repeats domain-containing protein n=1 Tax=Chlamydomonas eustigma TaxID=1157962 RepID=A0A250WVF1_9CHLO|nr:hypothetical protein CEUSTIGMA_g2270.t1 [Chlamydomonas eustigma]|eukprot:GAX74823.1 hypothetical protein CEUSTIGMA_g2270.t1 [Chlamydomonas eustigma]